MASTSKRGFASMDPAKQKEIASKGGKAAHQKGTAHEFTSDEARVAGRKGGEAVSRDRAHMSAIGREGGHSRGRARQTQGGIGGNGGFSGTGATDTERNGYIGHATDRGTESGISNRNERGMESNANREANASRRNSF